MAKKIDYKNFKQSAICGEAGKSYLINPNMLFGHESSDNLFVAPEDLNIYVELTTSKKSRSVIDITDDSFIGTSTEKGKGRVSFIDGALNGKVSKDKDGNEISKSFKKKDLEKKLVSKDGQKIESRKYDGCPRHKNQKTSTNILDMFS